MARISCARFAPMERKVTANADARTRLSDYQNSFCWIPPAYQLARGGAQFVIPDMIRDPERSGETFHNSALDAETSPA
ncbi:MAG: hypothetical protein AAF067_05300 [Pseudomonadota bacterium]